MLYSTVIIVALLGACSAQNVETTTILLDVTAQTEDETTIPATAVVVGETTIMTTISDEQSTTQELMEISPHSLSEFITLKPIGDEDSTPWTWRPPVGEDGLKPEPRSVLRNWQPHSVLHVDIQPRSIPFGVLQDPDGKSAKKRCRCIEKKRRKVVKEIRFIPLSPIIQFNGQKRNFTCKCSHLRKRVNNQNNLM